jgi:hypothetical protein
MLRCLPLMLMALAMFGCAGTSGLVTQGNSAPKSAKFIYSIDNPGGMTLDGERILRTQLDQQLASVLAPAGDRGAVNARITVSSYYVRPAAARVLVGIMAGVDKVNSTVTLIAPDGSVLGSKRVESKNATAFGTSTGMLQKHADEIATFVLAANAPGELTPAPEAPAPSKAPAEKQMKYQLPQQRDKQ